MQEQILHPITRNSSDTSDASVPFDAVIRGVFVENPSDNAVEVTVHSDLDGATIGAKVKVVDIAAGEGALDTVRGSGIPLQQVGKGKISFGAIGAGAIITILLSPAAVGA